MLQLRHDVGDDPQGLALLQRLEGWARELGFSQIGVAEVDLGDDAEHGLRAWLEAGFHGSMGYMAAHGMKRARPAELHPGAVRIITARMDYLPESRGEDWQAQEEARLTRDLLTMLPRHVVTKSFEQAAGR